MTVFEFNPGAGGANQAFAAYLEQWLPRATELIRSAPNQVSVALVGDRRMTSLHKKFSGIATPTDVLTFELETGVDGRAISGEIVLCVPFARREAKRLGVRPDEELLLYALHGVLHLSGFDDRDVAAYARMHAEEDRILKAIGIGPVFYAAT